jgi:hypothetical protein
MFFDALLTLAAAERDRMCVVASILPGERVWGRKKTHRIDDDVESDSSWSEIEEPFSNRAMAARLRGLPLVGEDESPYVDPDEGDIL